MKHLAFLLLFLFATACGGQKEHSTDGTNTTPVVVPTPAPSPIPGPAPHGPSPAPSPAPAPKGPIPSSVGYTTSGGHLYANGQQIELKGINWFGLEGNDLKLHGLWTGRTMQSFVDQMSSLGFNAFRIPTSPQTLLASEQGSDGYATPLAELKALLSYTQSKGIYVLLDIHQCSKEQSTTNKPGPGLGSCSDYSVANWEDNLKALATLSLSYPNVVGIDLFNEPYGFTWSAWSSLAGQAGSIVLATNPNLLVFVEGVGGASTSGTYGAFWGENLYEAGNNLPNLPKNKLVFSPHVYGPSVSNQPYFNVPQFPGNMPGIWNEHYGYLMANYTVIPGEFGGRFDTSDKPLEDALINYLVNNNVENFFFWCMNPNSGDTGGLLLDDWQSVDMNKYTDLKHLWDAK